MNTRISLTSKGRSRSAFVASVVAFSMAAVGVIFPSQSVAQVTYTLVPVVQTDNLNSSDTDTVTGTFTLVPGIYTSSSSVGVSYTFTMTSSDMGITPVTDSGSAAMSGILASGTLTATGTSITLSADAYFQMQAGGGGLGLTYVQAGWEPVEANGPNHGELVFAGGTQGPPATMQILNENADSSIGNPPWTIANVVPEPGSAVLAAFGGIGILLRRRKRSVLR